MHAREGAGEPRGLVAFGMSRVLRMRRTRTDARPLQSPCSLSCPTLSAQPPQDPGCHTLRRCALRRLAAFVPSRPALSCIASSISVSGSQRAAAPPVPVLVWSAESEGRDQALLGQPAAGVLRRVTAPRGPRGWRFPEEPRPRAPDRRRRRRHAEREPSAPAAAARRARAAHAPRAGQFPEGSVGGNTVRSVGPCGP